MLISDAERYPRRTGIPAAYRLVYSLAYRLVYWLAYRLVYWLAYWRSRLWTRERPRVLVGQDVSDERC